MDNSAAVPESTELLPCPFCGEQPHLAVAPNGAAVSCMNDDCHTNSEVIGDSRAEAIAAWNTRKPAASPVAGVSAEKPETDWDERYRTMPATKCACGSKDIPAAIDGLQYYWQRHSRTGCTLELPNLTCWCGLKRSEHIDGHANPIVAQPSAEGDGKRALQVIQAALDESSKQYMSGIIGLSPAGTIHDALRREHLLAEGDGWIAFVCSLLPELDAAERLAQKVDRIHGLKLAFAIRKVSNRIIERAELPAPPSGQGEKERNEHLAS